MSDKPIPRRATGERPHFYEDPAVDRLHAITLALAAELAVARDRIDALERLLAARGLLDRAELGQYQPDAAAAAERAEARERLIQRVFAVLEDLD